MGSNPTLSARHGVGARLRVLMAVTVLVAASCSMLRQPPYVFDVTLPGRDNLAALPVRLFDHAGSVQAVEIPLAPPGRPANGDSDTFAMGVPGRTNAVAVVWLGGMCDEQVQLEYTGGDMTFTVTTVRSEGGCDAAGIVRSLIVVFFAPIDASKVRVQDMS